MQVREAIPLPLPANAQHGCLLNLQDLLDLVDAGEKVTWPSGLDANSARKLVRQGQLPPSIVDIVNSPFASSGSAMLMIMDQPQTEPDAPATVNSGGPASATGAQEIPAPSAPPKARSSLDDPDFYMSEDDF